MTAALAVPKSQPFVLVADTDGAVAQAYGVGTTFGLNSRVTFLIGSDGKIARVWPDVDPGVHAKDVLAAVDALPPTAATPAP